MKSLCKSQTCGKARISERGNRPQPIVTKPTSQGPQPIWWHLQNNSKSAYTFLKYLLKPLALLLRSILHHNPRVRIKGVNH